MRMATVLILACMALWVPGSLLAHHGTAGFYDQTKKVRIEGVAKQFAWRNPHAGLFLTGKDAAGKEVTYVLEMGSPNTLAKLGFNRLSIKPGDKVLAQVHVAFSNPLAGEAEARFIEVNGKQIATSDAAEE